ncbi:MAG: hypothetical protein IK088_09375, partial [Lachnospiraceae bacterium]|nr:hypothetical protein [Lachnospiraceae bacterium]
MNGSDLIKQLNDLDEDLIDEAAGTENLKPRRKVWIILAAAALLIVLSGAAALLILYHPRKKVTGYRAELLTEMNGIASAAVGMPDQAFQASALYQREGAAPELTVSFDGETYTGTYSHSTRTAGTKTVQDFYWVNEIVLCNQ